MDIFSNHPQWNDVKKICTKLKENGFTAWLAGGCVRDGLMGILPKDFDIATNARPKKIESFFNKTVDVGKAFGVIRVVCPSGDIEVATFRKDGAYIDGRHPTSVEVSTPPEDAKRRDFTVNALFYDIFEGEVFDYVSGMEDLKNRLLRTVGMADDRFREDRLRILRAVRFVSQLDFDLDPSTYDAVCKHSSTITSVSGERINDEISKLLRGKRVDRGIEILFKTGLLDVIFSELAYKKNTQDFFKKVTNSKKQETLGWCFIFSSIVDVQIHDKVFKRLKFSNEKKDLIKDTLDLVQGILIFDTLALSDKKRLAADPQIELATEFLLYDGKSTTQVGDFITSHKELPKKFLQAADILALGVKPGKKLGELLEAVYDEQLEGNVKNRGEALTWVKNQINTPPKAPSDPNEFSD